MAKINTIFSMTDDISSPLRNMQNELENTVKGFDALSQEAMQVNQALELAGKSFSILKAIGSAFADVVSEAGATQSIISKLTVALGDSQKAVEKFKEIQDFASVTPFDVQGTAQAYIMLKNAGMEVEELLPMIRMIGDLAQGNNQAFNNMALNMMQIKSNGEATAMDLKQFATFGVPITQALQEIGREGDKSFEAILQAMRHLTSEGGQFYNSMAMGASTLEGRMANLDDSLQQLKATIGNSFLPMVQKAQKILANMFENIKNWFDKINNHPFFSALFKGLILGAISAIGTAIVTVIIPNLVAIISKLTIIQALSGPLGWISLAIGGIATVMGTLALTNYEINDNIVTISNSTAIWAENVSNIKTDFETIKKIIGNLNNLPDYTPTIGIDQSLIDTYKTQLNSYALMIENSFKENSIPLNFDWRNANAEEFNKKIVESNMLTLNQIDELNYVKSKYDDVIKKLEYANTIYQNQNLQLQKQKEIMDTINESQQKGLDIEQKIQTEYAKTTAGQNEAIKEQIKYFENLRNAKGYMVASQGYNGTISWNMKYFTSNDLKKIDAILATLEGKLKTDSSGALVVSDVNMVDIADDYRELLSKRATERFNLQFKEVVPSVTIGDVTVNSNTDLDKALSDLVDGIQEVSSASLAG